MFHKIYPQKAEHTDGYIVQVADRETVQYLSKSRNASIFVDFGTDTGVYCDTLKAFPNEPPLEPNEREIILAAIVAGLRFMGCTVTQITNN